MISKMKCWLLTVCLGFVLCLQLVAQNVTVDTNTAPPESQGHPNPTQSTDPDYVLQPNDYIQIVVYQEDDLTTTTRLSAKGNIVLPLIGTLQVGGMTVADTTTLIQQKYKEGYLRDPKVTLTMVEFAKRRFSVLGQVQKPGSFEMPQQEEVSILNAIAQAGGFTDTANASAVSVQRNTAGKEQIFTIDVKEMAKEPTHTPFDIEPGDVVTVNESSKLLFTVLGQVQKPGSFEMQEETQVSILDAIAQAGGYTNIANPAKVNVRRKGTGAEQIFTINAKEMAKESTQQPFYVQPGDVITVSETIF